MLGTRVLPKPSFWPFTHTVSPPIQISPLFSAEVELVCFPPALRHLFSSVLDAIVSVSAFAGMGYKSRSTNEGDWESKQVRVYHIYVLATENNTYMGLIKTMESNIFT